MKNRTLLSVGFALLPIVASLLLTALLIVLVGSNPVDVFTAEWQGAFRDSRAFAGVVNFWIPLALCSLGLIVTFTAGLWNIGVEGQMMIGAVFASYAALFIDLPAPLLIVVEIILAMIGGGLWAALVGFLKTRLGVHEIFGGVALNALANVWSIYLISGPWAPSTGATAQATAPFKDTALLPPISTDFPVSLVALLLVAVSLVVVAFALGGTRWGLQLKATGKNAKSALLLGVPTTQSAMTAFIVCGMMAGIAGSYRVLFTYASLRPLSSGGIGFLALLVVLLVGLRPLFAAIVAFAFAVILGGSTRLKVALQLDQSLAGVLQGFIVLLVLLSNGLRQRFMPTEPEPPPPMTATVEIQRMP